eukprot:scaffold12992_cov58-Phaeocystis_antarctica.AAC.11
MSSAVATSMTSRVARSASSATRANASGTVCSLHTDWVQSVVQHCAKNWGWSVTHVELSSP